LGNRRIATDEDHFQEDYSADGLKTPNSEDEDVDSYKEQQQEEAKKLPSVNDPKLWRVRVKKGFERIAAMALMNKMIDYAE
jgi:hypothetical protein